MDIHKKILEWQAAHQRLIQAFETRLCGNAHHRDVVTGGPKGRGFLDYPRIAAEMGGSEDEDLSAHRVKRSLRRQTFFQPIRRARAFVRGPMTGSGRVAPPSVAMRCSAVCISAGGRG